MLSFGSGSHLSRLGCKHIFRSIINNDIHVVSNSLLLKLQEILPIDLWKCHYFSNECMGLEKTALSLSF